MQDTVHNAEGAEQDAPERSERVRELLHDLRTPLVAVRGYARMLLEERAGSITETQREYLGVIAENTTREIQLLDELQRLLQPSAGRIGEKA